MSWYTTGTINLTKGSKVVTGVGTKWANSLSGVSAGRMLILPATAAVEIYEIESIQSDTQLTLAENYSGATVTNKTYKIPTSPSVSIEQFSLEIASSLAYHQNQLDGWQNILTGTGDVTLTAPNGQKVTIKSQKKLADLIDNAVKKSGDTMTGLLTISDGNNSALRLTNEAEQIWQYRTYKDGSLGIERYDPETKTWNMYLRYVEPMKTWRFENIEDVTINGKSLLKMGDGGLLSNAPVINDVYASDFRTGFYRFDTNTLNTPIKGLGYVNKISWNANESRVIAYVYNSLRAFTGFKDKNSGESKYAEFITTANSTIDSNGFYKKASPILRLYGTENIKNVDGFKKSGCGLVNDLAKGVTAKRIDVGHYEIHGSLGFAKEGWYITLPEDANGNKKIFAEYSTNPNNVITVKTFTRKFDFEKCEVVAGSPIDITDDRWIDVRLEMPITEDVETTEVIEEVDPADMISTDEN